MAFGYIDTKIKKGKDLEKSISSIQYDIDGLNQFRRINPTTHVNPTQYESLPNSAHFDNLPDVLISNPVIEHSVILRNTENTLWVDELITNDNISNSAGIDILKLGSTTVNASHVLIAGGDADNYWGTLDNIAGFLSADKINSGIFSIDRIPNLPITKLITSGTNNNKYLKTVNGTPVWSDVTFPTLQLDDLSDVDISGTIQTGQTLRYDSVHFVNAKLKIDDLDTFNVAVGNNPAYLNMPAGTEIRRLGWLKFETLFESAIGGFLTEKTKALDPSDDESYIPIYETVMNINVNGQKALAVSSLATGLTTSPYNSVTEVFGDSGAGHVPLFKLVDTHYYKVAASVDTVDIGSIYFDAKRINTSDSTIDYDQITFAEIKARADTANIDFLAWSSTTHYTRGDRVSYNSVSYICTASYAYGAGQSGSNPSVTSSWKVVPITGLARGKLDFVLRNTHTATLGSGDDTHHTILSLDIDSGIRIPHHLTMDRYVDGSSSELTVAAFKGNVILGGGETDQEPNIILLSTMGCFSNTVKDVGKLLFDTVHFPVTNTDRGFYRNGNDIMCRTGANGNEINLTNAGGGSVDFTSIASDVIPDNDNSRSLGTATKEWKNLYIDGTAYIDFLYLKTGVPISGISSDSALGGNNPSVQEVPTENAVKSYVDNKFNLINQDLIPDITKIRNLGNSSKYWYNAFIDDITVGDYLHVKGDIEIDGDLNHDGSKIGFRGKTPIVGKTWAIGTGLDEYRQTPGSIDLTFNSFNFIQLSKAFATLVQDLRDQGIVI